MGIVCDADLSIGRLRLIRILVNSCTPACHPFGFAQGRL